MSPEDPAPTNESEPVRNDDWGVCPVCLENLDYRENAERQLTIVMPGRWQIRKAGRPAHIACMPGFKMWMFPERSPGFR